MSKYDASLEYIEHNHSITKETDYKFLHLLQSGLLLALKEQGRINDESYDRAQALLVQQGRKWMNRPN